MRLVTRTAGAMATPAARTAQLLSADRPTLTILGWHRFGDVDDEMTTTIRHFETQLDILEDWGATVLPLDHARRLMRCSELPPKAVALTLDDGYLSCLEQAWPILRDRNLPATLFAVSDYLDGRRRFPWDEAGWVTDDLARIATARQLVDAAQDGLDIGSHTVSHRWLPSLSLDDVALELTESKDALEDLLGTAITAFAYPMGGWSPQIRDIAEDVYDIAVTVDRGRNYQGHDEHALRRAFAFDRAADFRRQLDGAYTWMRPLERRRARTEPEW